MNDPSGLSIAEQAHAAGAVEPVETLPNQLVRIEFVLHGTGEQAETLATGLGADLASRADVDRVAWSVQVRE